MNDNGNKYALAALRERRAEVDGQFRDCERRIRYLRECLVHLDGTLKLFDPDGTPADIKAKRPYKKVKLFANGKLSRIVRDALRKSDRPMSTKEVTAALVAELGYGPDAGKGMTNRVRATLAYLTGAGAVRKIGEREGATWALREAP